MHANRSKYSLKEYQEVLKKRDKSFAILLENKETNKTYFFLPPTKSMWSKEFTTNYTNKRFHKMYNRIKIGVTKMITLTYSTKLYTPEQVAKRHKRDIKKFIRLIRQTNKDFQYTYFIELTKRYMIHFHLYTDQFIEHRELKKLWFAVTGSPIVYVNLIKTEKQKIYTANYNSVVKKFSFGQLEFAFKNINRFWVSSRGFFPKEEEKESIWEFLTKVKLKGEELQSLVKACKQGNVFFIEHEDIEELLQGRNAEITLSNDGKTVIYGLLDHL